MQAANALPWAKLGIARVELETGQLGQACRTLESLISEQPSYADAYDVMGRVQVEQGDMDAALETYRTATKLTPASITRLQKQGMLAYYMGQTDEAVQALERTVRIGISSKMFDCQTLVLLAVLYFDQRDNKAFVRNFANLALAAERRPESVRLRRFLALGEVLKSLLERRIVDAVPQTVDLAQEIRESDFDFEAASNLITLLSRVRSTEIELPKGEEWIAASGAAILRVQGGHRHDVPGRSLPRALCRHRPTGSPEHQRHGREGDDAQRDRFARSSREGPDEQGLRDVERQVD